MVMADIISQEQESTPYEPKRRKVRKGTQSCWECKRRKIRCTFTSSLADICDRCWRRGTSCISQEFPDEPAPRRNVEDRLGRLETLIEQLVDKVGFNDISDISVCQPQDREGLNSKFHASMNSLGILNSITCEVSNSTHRGRDGDDAPHHPEYLVSSRPALKQSYPAIIKGPRQNTQGYDELSRALMATWPSQRVLDLILEVPVEVSRFLHGLACSSEGVPSPREMLQLPPQGSHPVLIAWRLLSLAKYLQAILPTSVHKLNGLGVDYHSIMVRAVETAHIVTCNDEVVYSIEGIECIMLESMYQNDAGNLRLSLLALRRGMALAETMGFHRQKPLALNFLKPETRHRFKPKHLWFRLVHLDRYLSLMLGVPQGSLDDSFATPEALKDCAPVERMQRIDCVAAGRILQRSRADMIDLEFTRDIDKLLQKAAASVPCQWWLVPNLTATDADTMEAFEETDRLMSQFAHFHILARLHLPCVLLADQKYYCHCISAVNANREVLTRFVSFRNQTSRCYHSTLFLAFIASVTLCLAHINAHVSRETHSGTADVLAHQRPSDRGMMERALELMEFTSSDVVAARIATILRHLLLIEDDAACGGSYRTNASSKCSEEELECDGKVSESGNVLRIYIPHFGAIQITYHAIEKSVLPVQMLPMEEIVPQASITGPTIPLNPAPPSEEPERHVNQSLEMPNTAAAYTFDDESANPEWHPAPSHLDSVSLTHESASAVKSSSVLSFNANSRPDTHLVPGVDAFIDEWSLQGIDMALFDSLLHGASLSGYDRGARWDATDE